MINEEGEWKLAHGHWSQPAEGQDVGESVPYLLLKEKNRELEEKVAERTREIEKQNIELHKLNKAKTDLLSIIAHDLRSPFNAFMGLTEVMLMNFDENITNPAYFRERITLINERAHSLFNVADTLLNWAWTQTNNIEVKKTKTNLNQIINNQLNNLRDISVAKHITVHFPQTSDTILYTDSDILGIIIRNIISNSIKYSYKNGKVSILVNNDKTNVIIRISDSGIGMQEDRVKEILASSTNKSTLGTSNEKGIGLGISICKDLISKIGGRLHISSEIDKGTEVSLTIPVE